MSNTKSSRMKKLKDSTIIEIKVKPQSKKFKIKFNDIPVISCTKPPMKGKANQELLRELSRIFNTKVEIISGHHSRRKKIKIKDISEEETRKILTELQR